MRPPGAVEVAAAADAGELQVPTTRTFAMAEEQPAAFDAFFSGTLGEIALRW